MLAFTTAVLVGACGAGSSASSAPSPSPSAKSAEPAASTSAPVSFAGAWQGDLVDPSGSYPIRLALDGCATDGAVCGELEYGDPGGADNVLCASELTRTGIEDGVLALDEHLVYHPWQCFESEFEVNFAADGSLEIEQGAGGEVCCRGSLERTGDTLPAPELPAAAPLEGLGAITASVALGGATTQYGAGADGSLWMPLEDTGQVARLDASTAEILALIDVGDPAAVPDLMSDPHGVAVADGGVWVSQAAEHAVARIDPATNAIAESIPVQVVPYALALDGPTLWVSSFLDDRVLRVDLESGSVVADIEVPKPTGIAVGFDAVWVVGHRDDKLVRIDPRKGKVVAEISLGERGTNDLCGMCVENVVVGKDAVWTANNEGRSVSRIDPGSNKVTATIDLPLRPWQVSAGSGSIWASQFDDSNGGGGGVARIDEATNEATSYPVAGALGVTWAGDALWVTVPSRRGDALARLAVGQ